MSAGVASAGLAMPLLVAGGAQAADGATWDHVAECESGGLWSANAGNGYYGGLQLTLETWKQYGGADFATRPDLASRHQQIQVAEKILADQGPRAWPSCAISAGLSEEDVESGLPGIPDAPEAPEVEVPEADVPDVPGVPGFSGDSGQAPAGDEGARGASGASDGKKGRGASGEDDSGEGSAAPGGAGAQADPGRSGRTDTPDAGREAEARDEPGRTGRGARTRSGGAADDSYRVRPGDSLSAIADAYGTAGGWTALYEDNRETVGDDPDLIRPGQLLDLRTGGELR
ncbi:transglycosylase family protein [Streptomyces sp. TR02-1]|uniref:transglycosylase family protein n=1 Tax=Streptomyces sp. TR02-1 TaxID=3385977 RepID=UPI00399FAFC3